jgi:hypothetical protein
LPLQFGDDVPLARGSLVLLRAVAVAEVECHVHQAEQGRRQLRRGIGRFHRFRRFRGSSPGLGRRHRENDARAASDGAEAVPRQPVQRFRGREFPCAVAVGQGDEEVATRSEQAQRSVLDRAGQSALVEDNGVERPVNRG